LRTAPRANSWLRGLISFDAIVEPVEAHGGEVLKFLGDGLLATFGFTSEDRQRACATALAAAEAGLERMAALNRGREKAAAPALQLDVALHVGDVIYGNVGSSGRLDFTIIGPAVNEVCRMEALCEPLGAHLLVSADFADGCGRPMVSLGRHRLKGIATPRELFCAGR
jgi:adenylate cyclase